MGVRAPRPVAILTAVLFALSVFGFTLFVWRSFGGTIPFAAKGYRFHVQFGTEAVQLTSGAEARISGVRVGKVKSVAYTNGRIDAEIQLESKFAPMPSDARAIIRSKTLLGESYIELTPGTKSASPLREDGVLPLANVKAAQTLDEVLGTFDKQTRDDFKKLLDSLAVAFDGRAQDVNDTLGNLPGASADLREFTELLDRQRSGVQRLLRESGTALQAIGDSQADVQALVRSADAVFGTTASRAAEVTRLVQALPPFLRDVRQTLEVADATTTDAAPALAALRPTAPLLRPALNAANRLAPELERTFIGLPPVLDAARDGLPALTRIVDVARPAMRVLYPAGRELVPVLKVLEAYREEGVTALANNGAATNGTRKDGAGRTFRYLRALAALNSEAVLGLPSSSGSARLNPYTAPGGNAKMSQGGFEAFDCRNATTGGGLAIGTGAPACKEQQPWDFRGVTRSFPHVERDAP